MANDYNSAYTGAEIDARLKRAYETPGRNLLDNGRFLIGQRGGGHFSAGITADRWSAYTGGADYDSDAHTITLPAGAYFGQCHPYSHLSALIGNVVTASILLSNGVIRYTTTTWTASLNIIFDPITTGDVGIYVQPISNNQYWQICVTTSAQVTIKAVKIELGACCTIAYDADTESTYMEEMMRCQRYCQMMPVYYQAMIHETDGSTYSDIEVDSPPMAGAGYLIDPSVVGGCTSSAIVTDCRAWHKRLRLNGVVSSVGSVISFGNTTYLSCEI